MVGLGLGLGLYKPTKTPGSFDPLSLNPVLYHDLSNTDTITSSGSLVSNVDDLSGNDYDATQAVASDQPSTGTRTLNSLNVLDYDGSSDYMTLGVSSIEGTGLFCGPGEEFTIICVVDTDGNGTFISKLESVSGPNRTWQIGRSSGQLFCATRGNTTFDLGDVSGSHIVVFVWDGSTLNYCIDGGSLSPITVGTDADADIDILVGARTPSSPAFHFDGGMGELFIADYALSADQLNLYGNFADEKWAITWTDL